jgi:hypothetical protein
MLTLLESLDSLRPYLSSTVPEGSTSTYVKYTGECILTSYEKSGAIGDVVTYSAEFQVTGAVTRGTYS